MDDEDGVRDCVSCDGIAEAGDECWECHDGWRYIAVPSLT